MDRITRTRLTRFTPGVNAGILSLLEDRCTINRAFTCRLKRLGVVDCHVTGYIMTNGEDGSVKVVEIIGESSESWKDAAQQAVDDASETLDGLSGVEIVSQTAEIENDEIVQYRATVHLSFPVQR